MNSPYLTNIKRTFGVSQIQSWLTVNGGNTFSTIVFFSFVDPFFFAREVLIGIDFILANQFKSYFRSVEEQKHQPKGLSPN